jgi:hypothetical protein
MDSIFLSGTEWVIIVLWTKLVPIGRTDVLIIVSPLNTTWMIKQSVSQGKCAVYIYDDSRLVTFIAVRGSNIWEKCYDISTAADLQIVGLSRIGKETIESRNLVSHLLLISHIMRISKKLFQCIRIAYQKNKHKLECPNRIPSLREVCPNCMPCTHKFIYHAFICTN